MASSLCSARIMKKEGKMPAHLCDQPSSSSSARKGGRHKGKMATRKTTPKQKQEAGTNSHPKNRGRKSDFDKLLHLIDGYMTSVSPEVRDLIHEWERDLRELSAN